MNLDNLSHSDPYDRAVREDWELQQGLRPVRLGAALDLIDAANANDANDAATSAADLIDAAAATSDDDDASAAADYYDADDDASNDATNAGQSQLLFTEIDMEEGLTIVGLPGGWYGRSVFVIGWLKRINGDEYVILNQCTITRRGQFEPGAMHRIAVEGPGTTHNVSAPSKVREPVHRVVIKRTITGCNEKAWKKHCPKPGCWVDESP